MSLPRRNIWRFLPSVHPSRGAALAYVVGIIAVMSILVGLGLRMIRFNDTMVSMDRWDTQARLLAHSGLDYALSRIGRPPAKQDLSYATDSLVYNVEDSSLTFQLKVQSWGLYAMAKSTGKTRLPGNGRSKTLSAYLGQSLDLGRLPAICLLGSSSNLALAGNAQVTGPVMLWRGNVRRASDSRIRWQGKAWVDPPLWDSLHPAWKTIHPDFGRSEIWIRDQNAMMKDGTWEEDPDHDSSTMASIFHGDSGLLVDTLYTRMRIIARNILRVGAGARLRECKLIAREIHLESGAHLSNSLVYASRVLNIKGTAIRGGQFIAQDTLRLETDIPLMERPLFYVHGRVEKPGLPDSTFVGGLLVEKAHGSGLFIAALPLRPVFDYATRLFIKPGVRIAGLVYSASDAQFEGELDGSLICHGLKFAYDGTLFGNHLRNARISAVRGRSVVTAPLTFPGWEPVALRKIEP